MATKTDATGKPLPRCRCPACRYAMDAATPIDDKNRKPKSGSLSICCNCGEMLRYKPDLSLELLPTPDFNALPADLKAALREIRRQIIIRGAFKDE